MMASTLFLLLLGVIVRILIPMLSYFRWTSARSELVQAAAMCARHLVGDLQRAPLEGIQLASDEVFSIHGIENVTNTGRPAWSSRLIVYSRAQSSLTRFEGAVPTGTPPLKPSLADLNAFVLLPQQAHKTLVRGLLTEFSLNTSAAHSLPLRLRMTLRLDKLTYQHVQSIHLRNGG